MECLSLIHILFDISDTHMVAGGRSPYLWQMQEHQREEILTHLEEVYGLEEKDTATLDVYKRQAFKTGEFTGHWFWLLYRFL